MDYMEQSYSIKDLISLLLSNLVIVIIVTLLGGAAAFGYTRFFMPLEYSSHITMYVQSYKDISESPNNMNNISNSKQLVNTYIEVLKDDAVMQAVGTKLLEQFDTATLSECFSVSNGKISSSSLRSTMKISSVPDTSALKVNVTTLNPEVSAAFCNDLTIVAPQYVEDAVGVGSINTINTAEVYRSPVGPNVPKNTAIGLAAGFLLIVFLILFIDFFDNTIKDTDVLFQQYHKAIIGEIQQFGADKKKTQDESDYVKLTDQNVPFYVVESYKSIRTNIWFSLSTAEKKIFVVSSANPHEGKSTTSSNIAIALAQGGNKVLLIDADMRKAVQHKVFGLKNKKGLSTAISKMHRLEDCIQKNVMENLDVMTGGPVPPNPSELLASENMGAMLDELSRIYSIIVIDTPPVNVVTDAIELARYVAGIVLVIRYGETTGEELDIAYKKLEFAQMNLFGFIMNGIRSKHNGRYYTKYKYKDNYYKKGYGYGYGYGHKPEMPDQNEEDEKLDFVKSETESVPENEPVDAEAKAAENNPAENTASGIETKSREETAPVDSSYYSISF